MLKRTKECGTALGMARPATPAPIYAEDFSELSCAKTRERARVVRRRSASVH